MKALTVWFDLVSPDTDAWFAQWPRVIEGHGVVIEWRPVASAGQPRSSQAEPWLRALWASAPAGRTPSRWLCGEALQRWQAETATLALGTVPARDPWSAEVTAALQAASAAACALGITRFPAVSADGWHADGVAGLDALAERLSESP